MESHEAHVETAIAFAWLGEMDVPIEKTVVVSPAGTALAIHHRNAHVRGKET